eukprot:gene7425-9127_t
MNGEKDFTSNNNNDVQQQPQPQQLLSDLPIPTSSSFSFEFPSLDEEVFKKSNEEVGCQPLTILEENKVNNNNLYRPKNQPQPHPLQRPEKFTFLDSLFYPVHSKINNIQIGLYQLCERLEIIKQKKKKQSIRNNADENEIKNKTRQQQLESPKKRKVKLNQTGLKIQENHTKKLKLDKIQKSNNTTSTTTTTTTSSTSSAKVPQTLEPMNLSPIPQRKKQHLQLSTISNNNIQKQKNIVQNNHNNVNNNNNNNNVNNNNIQFHKEISIKELIINMGKEVNITRHEYSNSWGEGNINYGISTYPFKAHTITERCWNWFKIAWAAQREFGMSLVFRSHPKLKLDDSDILNIDSTFFPTLYTVLGISVSWAPGKAVYFLPLLQELDKSLLEETIKERWDFVKLVLENPTSYKYMYNSKIQLKLLLFSGIELVQIMDPKIASWVVNMDGAKDRTLDQLYEEYSDRYQKTKYPNQNLFDRAYFHCYKSLLSMQGLLNKMRFNEQFLFIFNSIEMKVLPILARMEFDGVGFSKEQLLSTANFINEKLEYLNYKSLLYLPNRKTIDLTSLDEVSDLLFVELKLPQPQQPDTGFKKEKGNNLKRTHISTNGDHLQSIAHHHPLVNIILEHRSLTHTKTHYQEVLSKYDCYSYKFSMQRIHPTFDQTSASSGRLACTCPNLQNIAHSIEVIKAPEGYNSQGTPTSDCDNLLEKEKKCPRVTINIRNSFISSPGHFLVSFDYRNIELRILAHFSGDKKLLEIFSNPNLDAFKVMASQMIGKDYNKISEDDREMAKGLSYGVLYGMGYKSLQRKLNISIERAKEALKTINETYKELSNYLKKIHSECCKDGYVTTLYGRKRFFPGVFQIDRKKDAKDLDKIGRAARNTVPQGTAADIAKLAMIKVYEEIKKVGLHGFLIIQIHDELLFDIPENELKESVQLIKTIMESVSQLNVELPVRVSYGKSWGSMKPF